MRHGIRKAIEAGVSEYGFICGSGFAPGQDEFILAEIDSRGNHLDLFVLDMHDEIESWTAVLNPVLRGTLGDTTVTILQGGMKLLDGAQQASLLWNSLAEFHSRSRSTAESPITVRMP